MSSPSKSDPYARALKIMRGKAPDVSAAKKLLEEGLRAGDHRAQYALATWYMHGMPPLVEVDLPKALKMLKEAAKAGVPEAQYDYAISLETGKGVKKNERLALRFHLRAALSGDVDAMEEVGRMYYYGIGVAQDRDVARIWLARHHYLKSGA